MNRIRRTAVLCALLSTMAACADLDVTNQNNPDADRALTTPGDIEALVSGSFRQWFNGASIFPTNASGIFGPALSNMAWQHSQWPANFGVVLYSAVPRQPLINDGGHTFYPYLDHTWLRTYRALAAISQGMGAIDGDPEIAEELGLARLARLRAYAAFVQGVSHATIAMMYDGGFVVDETKELFDESGLAIQQPVVTRQEMLNAAIGYFQKAIDLSTGATNWPDGNTIPAEWMSAAVAPATLVQLSHSMRARYRAAFARDPAERAAVDWAAVLADINAGLTANWSLAAPRTGGTWTVGVYNQFFGAAWQQLSYQVLGMADQSGKYEQWLAIEPTSRLPDVGGGPFLIITPDKRFPQGATLTEQAANRGTLYDIPVTGAGAPTLGNHFQQPGRGTYRWSYYWARTMRDWGAAGAGATVPLVHKAEMDLLKAEALYRLAGNQMTAEAAALVNITRMAAGLDDISDGVNDSCVPRLWTGDCGDFFEALKWEKRLETIFAIGFHFAPWYFEGRGWGDLYRGTPLQLPMPCVEAQTHGQPCGNYGGGAEWSAAVSVYNWPHEN